MMATIKPDSLRQHFSFFTVKGKLFPVSFRNIIALLSSGILPLTKKLEASYNQWKPLKVIDSLIIFTVLVDRVGQIGKLTLLEGTSSEYSNKVLDFLTRGNVLESTIHRRWSKAFGG